MTHHLGLLRRKCLAAIALQRFQIQRKLQIPGCRAFSASSVAFQATATSPKLPVSYHCHEAWQRRLQAPILQKVVLEDLFYQMDIKYQPDKVISPIDVDLYVNKVTQEDNLEEMEELVYRLRKSPSAIDTLPSTGHAFVRSLIELDRPDMLFRILDDRMNYGVFLDFFTANLLMDKFLSAGNYKDAAKIAGLLMLQEDFGPLTTNLFSILSCLKFLETEMPRGSWDPASEAGEESKDDEEVKYRVKYLRNPFFDDHFELSEPQSIVGKTLAYVALQLSEDETLANSVEIYGWALYDKWLKVERRLTQLRDSKKQIHKEIISKIAALADSRLAQIEAAEDKKLAKPKLMPFIGLNQEKAQVEACFQRLNWEAQCQEPLPRVKALLTSPGLVTSDLDLVSQVNDRLDQAISQRTEAEVKEMSSLYAAWEEQRIVELENQIQRFKEIQLLLSHKEQKRELKEREDAIFFFDHEEEWMMKLEEKEAAAAAAAVELEKPVKVSLAAKSPGASKQTKKEDDSDYVSPII